MLNMLDEWVDSTEGQKYFDNIQKIAEIKKGRFSRFEEYLKSHDFDNLLYHIILEHDDEYRENCYHKGIEPYPNNKLSFIFEYIENNYSPIIFEQLDGDFPNRIWLFRGYYFQMIWGQGVAYHIYNKEDMRLIFNI